jgi:hypothetical protein
MHYDTRKAGEALSILTLGEQGKKNAETLVMWALQRFSIVLLFISG